MDFFYFVILIMKILSNALIYYLFFVLVVFYFKPMFLFKSNGKLREYGVGKDFENYHKSLFNFLTVSIFFILICLKFNKLIN